MPENPYRSPESEVNQPRKRARSGPVRLLAGLMAVFLAVVIAAYAAVLLLGPAKTMLQRTENIAIGIICLGLAVGFIVLAKRQTH